MPKWCPLCCFIRLDKEHIVALDPEDWVRLHHYNWFAKKSKNGYYAARKVRHYGKVKLIYMHREIAGTPVGYETHHKNTIKLDNRKENLEITTPQNHRFISRGKRRICRLSNMAPGSLR